MRHCILLTGATGLIGSEIARFLAEKGDTVIALARNQKKLDELVSSVKSSGEIIGMAYDLMKQGSIDNLLDTMEKLGLLPDTLINNARSLDFLKVNENGYTESSLFLKELHMDVVVPYELSFKLALMVNTNLKNIINIGSMYGVVPFNPHLYSDDGKSSPIQYSVSKAALIHLTKELAVRFRKKIKVNCISFGGVEGRVDMEFKEKYANYAPLGRMLDKSDLTGAIEFLMSNGSQCMFGQNIIVDGGWTVW